MFDLLSEFYNYYYLVLILQAICVFHSMRRGNHQKWIWIIVFLPLIGCVAYIFTEVIKRQHVSALQNSAANIVNPGGRIASLEKNFKFSDTFTNRMALADAYLESGMNEKAIVLYEGGRKGIFVDNEHILKNLMHAYYNTGRFDEVTLLGAKVVNTINFSKSHTNLIYVLALEKTGKTEYVEKQYQAMNHRYSNYEARYNYGMFLLKQNRLEDASLIFYDVVEESEHMNRREKGNAAVWINKSKEELQKLIK